MDPKRKNRKAGAEKNASSHREEIRLFGSNFRLVRRSSAYTAEDIAARTGIAATYIRQIERGEVNPTLNTLCILADAVGVPVHRLLTP